jgi:predicted DNA repair protein MutK
LDDVAALAKVAAASLDDAAAQATRAGAKAAGVVIDDAAVTPRYVVGFAAERELPIIGRIALGSLKNKLVFLLPAALVLGLLAPWAITPLLMLGGAYLCYEGAEKVFEALWPHEAHRHEAAVATVEKDGRNFEEEKVRGAIKTDFILSAEIMAITLATVPTAAFWQQAMVLAVVGIGITALVYGAVALIVKADDAGVALARSDRPMTSLIERFGLRSQDRQTSQVDRLVRPLTRSFGRGLVLAMPVLLGILSAVGTAAMVWVGGGIIIHGLEEYGMTALGHAVHQSAEAVSHAIPAAAGAAEWVVTAAASGLVGLVLGAVLIPLVQFILMPTIRLARRGGSSRPA